METGGITKEMEICLTNLSDTHSPYSCMSVCNKYCRSDALPRDSVNVRYDRGAASRGHHIDSTVGCNVRRNKEDEVPDMSSAYVILSDSLGALRAIENCHRRSCRNKLIWEIKEHIISLDNQNKKIVLVWVPGHTGVLGNEKADWLAKRDRALRGAASRGHHIDSTVGCNVRRNKEDEVPDMSSAYVILSDSLGALRAIENCHRRSCRNKLIWEIKEHIISLDNQNKKIVLVWVPGHTGVLGNEKADWLAKRDRALRIGRDGGKKRQDIKDQDTIRFRTRLDWFLGLVICHRFHVSSS
ncbi:RNase H [Popillia japonica]|uniref:ribonuclease H n=1 Tax=Popillia japonica TaxID=7064 RepID=A0AAW1N4F2_POPJA